LTRLSRSHPRYLSLRLRARLADAALTGLVVPEGLIAQGRGEAFDYLLGERTTPSAGRAIRRAAEWLAAARRPVVSVNGNVAALAAKEIVALARARPGLGVEVNLFHRSPRRVALVAAALRAAGLDSAMGLRPTARIRGLPSDRAAVDADGIFRADVCLVPLEDGDRTEALRALGKRVISIDLNPLSRTSQMADLPIVDELTRALRALAREMPGARARARTGRFGRFNARAARADALRTISRRLAREARRRPLRPRPRGPRARASQRRP
jgi:4-phosphopantoate--beta-alanine ligase